MKAHNCSAVAIRNRRSLHEKLENMICGDVGDSTHKDFLVYIELQPARLYLIRCARAKEE